MSLEKYKTLANDVLGMVRDSISLKDGSKTIAIDPRLREVSLMVQMAKAILELIDDNLKLEYNGHTDIRANRIRLTSGQRYRTHNGLTIFNDSTDFKVFNIILSDLTKNDIAVKVHSDYVGNAITASQLGDVFQYATPGPRPIMPIRYSPEVDASIAQYQQEVHEMNQRDAERRLRESSVRYAASAESTFLQNIMPELPSWGVGFTPNSTANNSEDSNER